VIGRLTTIWLSLATAAAVSLFALKFEVLSLEAELEALNDRIVADLEAIRVLQAEWSYLNQPAKLQQRADRHLDLGRLHANQVLSLDQLRQRAAAGQTPPRPVTAASAAGPPPAIILRVRADE